MSKTPQRASNDSSETKLGLLLDFQTRIFFSWSLDHSPKSQTCLAVHNDLRLGTGFQDTLEPLGKDQPPQLLNDQCRPEAHRSNLQASAYCDFQLQPSKPDKSTGTFFIVV